MVSSKGDLEKQIEKKEKFCVVGGGFGHGVGMSQYGAQKMAQSGKNYIEILNMFF